MKKDQSWQGELAKQTKNLKSKMKEELKKEIAHDVIKIILDSKPAFFVSKKQKLPKLSKFAQEVLYEQKAEICTNVETYFFNILKHERPQK